MSVSIYRVLIPCMGVKNTFMLPVIMGCKMEVKSTFMGGGYLVLKPFRPGRISKFEIRTCFDIFRSLSGVKAVKKRSKRELEFLAPPLGRKLVFFVSNGCLSYLSLLGKKINKLRTSA